MPFPADEPQLYDPAQVQANSETLPLEGLLRRSNTEALKALRVAFPASVVAVDGDQTVDLQPLLQVRFAQSAPSNLPVLRGIPVVMLRGASMRLSTPIEVGDTGLAIIADRSLDTWLGGQGGVADPQDTRCHNIADAVFLPGLVPTGRQTTDTGTDMVLGNGQLTLRLQKNGHIKVNNQTDELVQVLHDGMQACIDTLSAIQSMQVMSPFGPQSLLATSIAQFAQIQARTRAILTRLDSFKG